MIKLTNLEKALGSSGGILSTEIFPILNKERKFIGTGVTYILKDNSLIFVEGACGIDVNDNKTPKEAYCEAIKIGSPLFKLPETLKKAAKEIAETFSIDIEKYRSGYFQYVVKDGSINNGFLNGLKNVREAYELIEAEKSLI
jgi:hypothetical protein